MLLHAVVSNPNAERPRHLATVLGVPAELLAVGVCGGEGQGGIVRVVENDHHRVAGRYAGCCCAARHSQETKENDHCAHGVNTTRMLRRLQEGA